MSLSPSAGVELTKKENGTKNILDTWHIVSFIAAESWLNVVVV